MPYSEATEKKINELRETKEWFKKGRKEKNKIINESEEKEAKKSKPEPLLLDDPKEKPKHGK